MTMPKKAFILYCPCQPDQLIPNVDLVTLKGCSGQIILEEQEDTTILQLLGLYQQNLQMKSNFNQRFHNLSLAVISDHKSTTDITQDLGCFHQNITSIEQITKVLYSDYNVVLVDFTGIDNPWKWINELLNNQDKDIIQCVVSPYTPTNPPTSFLPRQSYLMKNGSQVAVDSKTELMYSYLHAGSARTDLTSAYNLQDIEQNGANCKILAWHFLAEIGNKLGFVPKYGA
ncbi:hypothetical protein HPULCUR_000679 [Helicostylum pulchrum]|uniref:Uncharacterized protein n=1 Tax=Helicostylum pulchrum TaxID=562976 RepID=A0ABP9XMG7_9FUNG